MHFLTVLFLASAVTASAIPLSVVHGNRELKWEPHSLMEIRDQDSGFPQMNETLTESRMHYRTHNHNIFQRAPKKPDLETEAPPGTVWQGLAGSQWDDWKKDVVVKAWRNAITLASKAAVSLEAVAPGGETFKTFAASATDECEIIREDPRTLTKTAQKQYNLCYRKYLAQYSLAYGQFFGAEPRKIGDVVANFKKLVDQVEKLDAPERTDELYLTYGSSITVMGGDNQCVSGAQAVTIPASATAEVQGTSVPSTAIIIHLCDDFFSMGRLEDQLEKLNTEGNPHQATYCNLNNIDSTARVLLHEMTHLPWTLDTNRSDKVRDIIGYAAPGNTNFDALVSNSVVVTSKNQATITNFVTKNADSYAMTALYDYFNNLKECQGERYSGPNAANGGNCNADIWPNDIPKLVKTTWNNYDTK
ncbi:hypothetical protein F5884DRAFT_854262 [Xylogone sp. PMI_703]|nr:hypothetical protein F5884DRAFT_854262 [Xylogone sp. PMI_703]